MAVSLASYSVGTPDNAYQWYLHSSGVSLATGFRASLGDGTATHLWLDSNGIGTTGTFTHDGMIVTPSRCQRLTATVSNSTTTEANLPGLAFTPVSGAAYAVDLTLVATSAATTTGVQITNTGGAGTLYLCEPATALGIVATGGSYSPTSAPVASTAFVITLRGVFVAGSAAPLTFAVKSEVASSSVSILAGSHARYTKMT